MATGHKKCEWSQDGKHCMTQPSFNMPGKVGGKFCAVHRLPGMVNVVNKMCEVPNCFKRPSLNYPGVRPAVRCGEHKLEGMTNAFRKSSSSKSSSGGSKGVAEPRVKTSDGDTTDSGSDGDEAETSPAAAASCSGSPAHHAAAAAAAADASSPSAKPDSAAAAPAKRPRWGSGVAAQRAALASLHVAVDQQPPAEAVASPPVKSAPSSSKAQKSKEVLKRHLCQELAKAGLNGMEPTVEKYIEGISSETISSISTSSVGDSAMLAQMVSAIKQKLFSVATELVSSALKGGDSLLKAELYKLASIPVTGSRPFPLSGAPIQSESPMTPPPASPAKHAAASIQSPYKAAPASSALQAKTKKRKPDPAAPAAASPPTTAASAACSSSAPAVKTQQQDVEVMDPSVAIQRALIAASGVGGASALGSSSSSTAADASSCPTNTAPLNGKLTVTHACGKDQLRQAGNLAHEHGAAVDRAQVVKCEPET